MTTKTGMTSKVVTIMNRVLKGYIAEDAKAGIVECLDNEASAFATVNEARFELCKRLGAVKAAITKAREENKDSVPRGAWKHWCERNLKGQLQYSKANAYANVGMSDEPHAAFEDYKARDTRYKAKAELKAARLAAKGLDKDGNPTPVATDLTKPDLSAGQSDAGIESRADHTPPSAEELAASIENATRALVAAEASELAEAGSVEGIIRNAASVAGVELAPADGCIVTSETSVEELVEAVTAMWSGAKRARLAVALGGVVSTRKSKARAKASAAFDDAEHFATEVLSMAGSA